MASTVTRCSPSGLGRSGDRVANTPASGAFVSPRGDLPDVAPAVLHHSAAIAVRRIDGFFERPGARAQRTPIRPVGILDVQVEEGRHRLPRPHAADHEDRVADLNHRARKIRSAFGIGETGMENPNGFPVNGFEPVVTQALMEPDGLEQALGRHVICVAQGIYNTRTRAPGGIEIPGGRRHLEIAFAPVVAQSQVNAQKIDRI